MADMADGEHATDGHCTTPANTDAQGNAEPELLLLTVVAPGDKGPMMDINKGLDSVNVPKKNTPLEVLPHVDSSHDDFLAKGKELQGPASNLAAFVCRHVGGPGKMVSQIHHQKMHLENVGSSQVPQRRLKNINYIQKIESFVRKLRVSTSDEVISEVKDVAFLQQLLDDILNIQEFDAKKDTTPRFLSNSTSGGVPPDPLLEALVAAPLSYRRRASANDIPARIPHR